MTHENSIQLLMFYTSFMFYSFAEDKTFACDGSGISFDMFKSLRRASIFFKRQTQKPKP